MRSLIVIPRDTLYAPLYLSTIVQALGASTGVRLSVCVLHEDSDGLGRQIAKRLKLYGTRQFALFILLVLLTRLLAMIDRAVPLGRAYDIETFCRRHGLECFQADGVNGPAFQRQLKQRGVEALISIAVGKKFSPQTLAAVAHPLNVHSSLLPRHRGVMGLFWAHLEGDAEAGVTVHRMSEQFDRGAILGQVSSSIAPADSLHRLYLKAIRSGGALVASVLAALSRGEAREQPQDPKAGSYHSFPGVEEGLAYRRAGKAFFTLSDLWTHQ